MSPVTVTARICEALDAERARNPGADLLRAKEVVLQALLREFNEEYQAQQALRMDTPEMQPCQEQPYEVRHG